MATIKSEKCPTPGCGGELRAHCRPGHPTCGWKRCTRCSFVGPLAEKKRI